MAAQTTLQDVADRAGVHRSTVSLALREHPRISPEVRHRIQDLAREMGYRINPLVATLMRSRRSGTTVKHVSLAYVTNYPTRYGWRPPHHDRPDFFPGAESRARELGYKLDHFWLAEPGMTPDRFCDILSARAITGVLIGRLPPGHDSITFDWSRFATVALGYTLKTPGINHVAEDPFSAASLATEQCMAHGYRRIGFVFAQANDSPRTGNRWLGAFARPQLELSPHDRLPPCEFSSDPDFRPRFFRWLRKWKPDCLLVTHAKPIMGWLTEAGYRIPQDFGLATLTQDNSDVGIAGIHHDPAKLGGLATDMLVGMLHRGEIGLPVDPHFVLSSGTWVDGDSLKSV